MRVSAPSPTFFTLPECDHITALVRSDLVISHIKAFLSKAGLSLARAMSPDGT
jgi:hypothetical protein